MVAGSSSSIPRPGRACSCYLVRSAQANVLFDLGSGAFSSLRSAIEYPHLDAAVISHMHADHFLDIVPLRYALKYGPLRRATPLPLYLPKGGTHVLRRLCSAFAPEGTADFLDEVFAIEEFDERSIVEVNDLRLSFAKTIHYIAGYAIRAESEGVAFVYSSDTAPCDDVVKLAHEAELFMCECTIGLGTESGIRGHSTAAEAGVMAAHASAQRLVLTHYGNDYAADQLERAASHTFGGPCTIADDGLELLVAP
jgi:ribonuclease BN (tRNA processing enzyme)